MTCGPGYVYICVYIHMLIFDEPKARRVKYRRIGLGIGVWRYIYIHIFVSPGAPGFQDRRIGHGTGEWIYIHVHI